MRGIRRLSGLCEAVHCGVQAAIAGNCRGLIVDDSRVPKDGLDYQLATMALESGRNIKWVAVILGHSDPTITLCTYAYAMHKDNDDLGFLANNRGESCSPSAELGHSEALI